MKVVFVGFLAITSLVLVVQARGGLNMSNSLVPGMFIFGDSLMDPGNNNFLLTNAKAFYLPHGIDFNFRITGRFCNGKTIADFLSSHFGLPPIPPFFDWKTTGTFGVNYASAASGILSDTGSRFGDVWTMDLQVANFQITFEVLSQLLNGDQAAELVAGSLFLMSTGSNDHLFHYLPHQSGSTQFNYTSDPFQDHLIQEYTRQLKDIYAIGGRKFLIMGIMPLGCMPYVIAKHSNNKNECLDGVNTVASQFNHKLRRLVGELNRNLTGSCFILADIYGFAIDVINNPSAHGFDNVRDGCCVPRLIGDPLVCPPFPFYQICRDRHKFAFWDPFHPSEAFNKIISENILTIVQKEQTASRCKLF